MDPSVLKVDCREAELIAAIRVLIEKEFPHVILEVIQHDIGDVVIGLEKAVVERKTLKDLAASLRDGRYKEQSYRLQACQMPVYYIIEGDLRWFLPRDGVDKNCLMSAMVSLSLKKGFNIIRTTDVGETARFLCIFAKKVAKMDNEVSLDVSTRTPQDYCDVVKSVKKQNICRENMANIMLAQIPGVSVAVAKVIMDKYNSMESVLQTIRQDTDDSCFADLRVGKKPRHLNKTVLQEMKRLLL